MTMEKLNEVTKAAKELQRIAGLRKLAESDKADEKAAKETLKNAYDAKKDENLDVLNQWSKTTWEGVHREVKARVLGTWAKAWQVAFPKWEAEKATIPGKYSTYSAVPREVPADVALDCATMQRMAAIYPEMFIPGLTNQSIKAYFAELATVKAEREAAAKAREKALAELAEQRQAYNTLASQVIAAKAIGATVPAKITAKVQSLSVEITEMANKLGVAA